MLTSTLTCSGVSDLYSSSFPFSASSQCVLLLKAVNLLETHPKVTDIQMKSQPGVTGDAIDEWEAANAPFKLPDDLKSFYKVINGFQLTYCVTHDDDMYIPVGRMGLCGLKDLTPIPLPSVPLTGAHTQPPDLPHAAFPACINDEDPQFEGLAFKFDPNPWCGTTALIFHKGTSSPPSYWFRDRAGAWFHISDSFTDYLRILVSHVGLPCWQYAYTRAGIDPISQQWSRLIAPERLAVDDAGYRERFGPR